MKKIKPKNYTEYKKQFCEWTDKKNYLIQFRMCEFQFTHGMVIEKVQEVISFEQRKWLE